MRIFRSPFENLHSLRSGANDQLAQGEYPRFLTGSPDERAELLASLTRMFQDSLQTLNASENPSAAETARAALAGACARLDAVLLAANTMAGAFFQEAQSAVEQCEGALQSLDEQRVQAETAKLDRRRATLDELRTAMEKRDNAAAEASRLADEEAQLIGEIEGAALEKAAALAEAEAQSAVLESARAYLEMQERDAGVEAALCPTPSKLLDEARRNLNAARTANYTAAREARVAADGLTRLEERLAVVRKRRGEMRWQQSADHEAFEKVARTVRIFTPEALQEAVAKLEAARVEQEEVTRQIRAAEASRAAAEKRLPTVQGLVPELRAERVGRQDALVGLLQRREALFNEVERFAALVDGLANIQGDAEVAAGLRSQWLALERAAAALRSGRD